MHFTQESSPGRQTPTRVAALHASSEGWSLVVVASEGGSPSIVCAERVGAGDAEGVRRLMSRHGASTLVRVIPEGEAIVRAVHLPGSDERAAKSAIALMAEAQLPAALDPHRRGSGLLPLPSADEGTPGMLAGWFKDTAPARVLGEDALEHWTPPAAAIAQLLSLAERDWSAESAYGAISGSGGASAIVVADASGPRVRSGRIGDTGAALGEMCPGASLDPGRRVALDARTEEVLRSLAPPSGAGAGWIDQHAVAVGAALGALRSGTGAGGLFGILSEPPRYHYTLPQRLALGLADARQTRAMIALGLLLIFVAPVALVYARHATLEVKLERAQQAIGAKAQSEVDDLVRNAAFADELLERRVPYTKVLAAIADAMPTGDADDPLGVQVDRIDISPQRLVLRGEAASRQIVLVDFRNALADKAILSNVRSDAKDERDSDYASFTVTANISSRAGDIVSPVKLTGGFDAESFAVRLYGEEARGYDYASVDTLEAGPRGSGVRGGSDRQRGRTARFDAPAEDGGGGAADVPEELGAEKINAMDDAGELRKLWMARLTARRKPDLDDETRRTLDRDIELIKDRLKQLQGS